MDSRSIVTVLVVILVTMLLYSTLYFSGIPGNFRVESPAERLPQIPALQSPVGGLLPRALRSRDTVGASQIGPTADWGRDPFLTPRELWAIANYRTIDLTEPTAAPSGRYLSAVVMETTPEGLVRAEVRTAFENGVRLQEAGDFVGAEQAYRCALKLDPYNAKVNTNLGALYESQDRLKLAARHLRLAVAIAPDNATARNDLGVVLYRLGDYDGALIELNRSLALDPSILEAYTNRGLISTRWGRFDDAERTFLFVLQRDPENGQARYNLGLVYEETDRIDRAVAQYYDFLATDGSGHPEIARYLAKHLPRLEARLEAGNAGVSR